MQDPLVEPTARILAVQSGYITTTQTKACHLLSFTFTSEHPRLTFPLACIRSVCVCVCGGATANQIIGAKSGFTRLCGLKPLSFLCNPAHCQQAHSGHHRHIGHVVRPPPVQFNVGSATVLYSNVMAQMSISDASQ